MRGCITGRTTQILVGLHRIGLVGFREALQEALVSGLAEREAVVDSILEALSARNYLPDSGVDLLRLAVWREFQRRRGEDIRDLYSEIEVVVRGEPGENLDRFVETLVSVFGDFELRPLVAHEPLSEGEPGPQLLLGEDTVARGLLPRRALKNAVRKRITDW